MAKLPKDSPALEVGVPVEKRAYPAKGAISRIVDAERLWVEVSWNDPHTKPRILHIAELRRL